MAWESLSQYFAETGYEILNPLTELWNGFASSFPGIVTAVIVAIIGFIIGWILGRIVEEVLIKVGLDDRLKKIGAHKALGKTTMSKIMGGITKWYVFVVFLAPAMDQLKLGALSDILTRLVLWAPHLILAIFILIVGLIVGDYCETRIKSAKGAMYEFGGQLIRWIIVIAAVIIALKQIGVDVSIAENTFLIIMAGIAIAIALAVGISFGSGLKPYSKKFLDKLFSNL
ncbi:hypothetical protein KY325_05200 [Candidatus Woesearchaeota archaeon]|nr:hypothetical protein [Candidatus Woesearchaeota archaeon]MBW3018531.1 hypothetical protein [Candidatus Woesearchaeota archaeon]